jgi:hypothetical protein
MTLERAQLEALADLIADRLRVPAHVPPTHEGKPLVNARQAAELLGVDLKTVYRHARDLGGRKVGGAWRFDLDAGRAGHRTEGVERYASERPEPPRAPGTPRRKRIRKPAATDGHCRLLPVGRATDRREGSS